MKTDSLDSLVNLLRSNPHGMTCTQIGVELWGRAGVKSRARDPQHYSRPAGKLVKQALKLGLVGERIETGRGFRRRIIYLPPGNSLSAGSGIHYRLKKSGKVFVEFGTIDSMKKKFRRLTRISFSTKMDIERGVEAIGDKPGSYKFSSTNYTLFELIAYYPNEIE